MHFIPLSLSSAFIVEPKIHEDERGLFYRFYCKEEFAEIGHKGEWVQLNHSFTKHRGTIRGMHYQQDPHTEIKLVRCVKGKILDVIIDLRRGSSTFLKHIAVELSAENRKMMYVPRKFAHGFQTLSEDCELIYLHSDPYSPNSEKGIRYDDPILGISWPLPAVFVSDRDKHHPFLTTEFN